MRQDFVDDEHWRGLARERFLRLPRWGIPPTPSRMRVWLRRLHIPLTEYLKVTGYSTLEDFSNFNPDWPLRAFVGLLLEYAAEKEESQKVLRAYDRP